MKREKQLVGMMGEEIACKFLKSKGYSIIERNYVCKYGELDIVAITSRKLVIVEVKTRRNNLNLYACESVTPKKIFNIKKATNEYMHSHNYYDLDYRFDVIECYWQTKTINHIMDAF